MIKKCKVCGQIKDIKFFGYQFNKKQQKHYITPACKQCISERQRRYRKMPHHIKTREKYNSKGFYGWNIKLERELTRTNHRIQSLEFRNDWEKKCDNLGEISRRDNTIFQKRVSNYLTPKQKDAKIINTEINRLKSRNAKITSLKIITELFYSGPLQSQTTIHSRIKQTIWDRKIDKLIDQFNRSIKYRGA